MINDVYNFVDCDIKSKTELATLLRMGWQDDHFIKIRSQSLEIPNVKLPDHWTTEEQCFLEKVHSIIGKDKEITPKLGIFIQTIFGRNKETVKFDKSFPQDLPVIVKDIDIEGEPAPPDITEYSRIYLTPSLEFEFLDKLLTMPNAFCTINDYRETLKKDKTGDSREDKSAQKCNTMIESDPVKIGKLLGKELQPRKFTFSCAYNIPLIIDIFPCGFNDCWYRIRGNHFEMAFGHDISNGVDPIKYPWSNTYSGDCPVTLAENGVPSVGWVSSKEDYVTKKLDEDINRFLCPKYHPKDYEKQAYEAMDEGGDKDSKKVKLVWIDEKTERISDKDLHMITSSKKGSSKQVFIVQCSKNAECGGKCKRCVVMNNGPFKHLSLSMSQKGWGVVAQKDIPAGTYITDYAGEILDGNYEAENMKLAYSFEFNDDLLDNYVDAERRCNIGRFVNQSDDIEDPLFSQPNVYPIDIMSLNKFIFRVGYFSMRKIYAGEELATTYGGKYGNDGPCTCNRCLREMK